MQLPVALVITCAATVTDRRYNPLSTQKTESDAAICIKVASEFRGHGETILFVDDEPQIRAIARMVLRHLNFVPLTAANGADALVQALEHRTELRAIITDQQMPQMDGVAFVRGLRGILPHIPVVVASAQVEETVAAEFKSPLKALITTESTAF